ncbi:MAG TPA: hypothetical protein VHW73_12440 [Rudaea sp.]|jgi:hypothetical protein|nr:hypothetical protein [Rudaea sp.]
MNKPNLSKIYRNGTPNRSDAVSDVDQLIAEIPRSPLQRDLIRFARDLEPESAALSANLESVLNSGDAARHRRFAAQRSAHGRRNWRIASALAASLIAAVAVWNGTRFTHPHPSTAVAVTANDRIFSSLNEDSVATKSSMGNDQIFHGDFVPDEIFNASRHNNG